MLHPILIVLLVMLAKLHCGDGVGPTSWERRYGSTRSFPGPATTAPAPVPAPAPASPPPSTPSLRTSPSFRSRFSNANAPQQQSSPGLTQSASFKADSPATVPAPVPSPRGRRFSPTQSTAPQRSQTVSGADAGQFFPPEVLAALAQAGRDFTQHGPIIPDLPPGTIMVQVGPDGRPIGPIPPGYSLQGGDPVDISEYLENEKRKEEEADPLNHQINTEGEIIEQKLPSGGGDIVIKISGTNITQKKMNKLRELMEKSIKFVFENAMSKSSIMARLM